MPSSLTDPAPAPAAWTDRLSSAPALLGLLAVWLLATLGLRPLLVPDEGRYANVAREMLLGVAGHGTRAKGRLWKARLYRLTTPAAARSCCRAARS